MSCNNSISKIFYNKIKYLNFNNLIYVSKLIDV